MSDLHRQGGAHPVILVVDDDQVFCGVLAKALERRGFTVMPALSVAEARSQIESHRPDYAVVDLRIGAESGLALVRQLAALSPPARSVVLTGYGSIATAVEAMRLGARDYFTKPCNADQILAGFESEPEPTGAELPFEVPSLARLEWEHIARVLRECNGNVSKAARVLGIHRRTLQ